MRMSKPKVLAIIPARGGSKRIPGKNIRKFCGKPLIGYPIEQALAAKWIDRVIVDTDSADIARVAKRFGAEVPFLRPAELAGDKAKVFDAIKYLLKRLREDEGYVPTHIVILQTTSPLREQGDLDRCWKEMKAGGATTVLTICPTHPRLYVLDKKNMLKLVNGSEKQSTNMQAWPAAYILNGCFVYIVRTDAMLREQVIITKKTRGVICEKWRSADLDTPEDWVLAEFLFKARKTIKRKLAAF